MTIKTRLKTEYIIVHCSDTPVEENIGVAELKAKHIALGWSDVGYHYVIRRDGTVEEGRWYTAIGGHMFGWDSVSLGICLIGGDGGIQDGTQTTNYTELQMRSLANLLLKVKSWYPKAQITAPSDFLGVTSLAPYFNVKEWMKTIPTLHKLSSQNTTDAWLTNLIEEKQGITLENWKGDNLTEEAKDLIRRDNQGIPIGEYGPGEAGHIVDNLLALPVTEALLKTTKCYILENGLYHYFIYQVVGYTVDETRVGNKIYRVDLGKDRSKLLLEGHDTVYVQTKLGEVKHGEKQ